MFIHLCAAIINGKRKQDRRHITYYQSYHYSKYLGLIGSILICIGLILWFFIQVQNIQLIATITVTIIGLAIFIVATILFFISVYHTFMEQRNNDIDIAVNINQISSSITSINNDKEKSSSSPSTKMMTTNNTPTSATTKVEKF